MALGYLISPAFQYENDSGKPLVGGTIRVCRHGTTIPYITYADFNGNRNPEYVPLDAKGMAILLASDENVYDVYCYDRNGVGQWSRLNVSVGGGGGGGGGGEYYGGYGIDIEDGVISVDSGVIQGKLTEGAGIEILNGEIGIKVDGSTISVNVDGELEANIPAQVNADWNSSSGVSEILNKPDLSQYATQTDLAGIEQVPAVTSSDDGKVLTADYTGGTGSYSWESPQVGPTYTAGNGIDITSDVISAKVDGSTVTVNASGELVANVHTIGTITV